MSSGTRAANSAQPDGLGSTMAIVDASGNSSRSYQYDVYGAVTGGSGSLANEFDFAGQQTDATGLQYLRARYYDPETGTFLSREPLALNPKWAHGSHTYASGRPTRMTDPTGTVPIDSQGCEVGNEGCGQRQAGYMGCTWTSPQNCDLARGIYPRGFDEVGGWLREYKGEWQYCHSRDIVGNESYAGNPDCGFVTGPGLGEGLWSGIADLLRVWWKYSHGCRGDLNCEANQRPLADQAEDALKKAVGPVNLWACAADQTCATRVSQYLDFAGIPGIGPVWDELACRRQGGC